MRGLILAIQFLTRLPTPRVTATNVAFAQAIRWFPAVGPIVGAIVCGAAWTGAQIDPAIGAAAGLCAWVAVTGALHLDGLGDIADAAGAAHKGRERLLTVLADPHAGSFAVVAIGLQLISKFALLQGLVASRDWAALILIPFAARIAPLVWTRLLPSLHTGLAARFRDAVRWRDVIGWSALLAGAAVLVPALLIAPVLMLAWAAWLRSRIGGISGDGHGAGIELVESGLMLAVLVVQRATA